LKAAVGYPTVTSDLGPLIPWLPPSDGRTPWIVGLGEARHVADSRPDESAQAEAQDRALEGALRSALSPFQAGIIRRRYWNGWTWEQIGQYYGRHPVGVRMIHVRALLCLREALR
jgi:DNA-directed RNA polymerase sigma subunit (sigma70/sigma32)